jgi:hypothetical protein
MTTTTTTMMQSSDREEREELLLFRSDTFKASSYAAQDVEFVQNDEKKAKKKKRESSSTTRVLVLSLVFIASVCFSTSASFEFSKRRAYGSAAVENGERKNKEDNRDSEKKNENKKGRDSDERNPMVIVQRNNEKDYEDLKRIKEVFEGAYSIFGANAMEWPENLSDAEYGVEPLRIFNRENFKMPNWRTDDVRRNKDNLKGIPWVSSIDERNPTSGMLGDGRIQIAHHIGCMYAHFNAWRAVDDMAYEQGDDKIYPAWIMEADNYVEKGQMKPRMERLLKNAPKDYDYLHLKKELFEGICGNDRGPDNCKRTSNYIKLGDSHGVPEGHEKRIYFYSWPLDGPGAGLSSYAIGPNFSYKAFNFISRKGADMIDAFMFGKLCRDDYVSDAAAQPGNFMLPNIGSALVKRRTVENNNDGNKLKVLNCYLIGDVETHKIDSNEDNNKNNNSNNKNDDARQSAAAALGKDEQNVNISSPNRLAVTIFKAKVHTETASADDANGNNNRKEKETVISIEHTKPNENTNALTMNIGPDSSITESIERNKDGSWAIQLKDNHSGNSTKITIDTTKNAAGTTSPSFVGEMLNKMFNKLSKL